jgi:arginine/serine-rich splicing factor 7
MSHRYRSSPKLFVANISSRVTRGDLEDKFDRYGKIINVQLRDGRDRERFAFVEYDDVRDAEYAYDKLQGYEFFGRELRIEYSKGSRRDRERNEPKEGTNCFICGQKTHWAADCPNGAHQGIKKGTCFVCGSTGHKMRDCPKHR